MLHRLTLLAVAFFTVVLALMPSGLTGLVPLDLKLADGTTPADSVRSPSDKMALPTSVEAPAVIGVEAAIAAIAAPAEATFEATLASYSTRYHRSGQHRSRAHNVEHAAEKLDGAIIEPGGRLSFNTQVGPRDRANGFRRAMVIDGGELVPGMGGGVCQVASTLHAAALEGGLELQDYRPHSRPSHYIPMGMDATVSWPQIDLVVANPFEFPVRVQARAEEGEMHVALVGQARPRDVEIARRVLGRTGYAERVVEDPTLPPGARVVSQRGIRGARVERTRTITENGETRVELAIVRYPSTDEIVRVGTAPASTQLAEWNAPIGPLALR
jgi:vancomycin resistance protein YoaR